MKNILFIVVVILYLVSLATILLTVYQSGYDNFLKDMTQENAFFESVSVFFLVCIFIYGMANFRKFDKLPKILIFSFSILAFLAAMEELSWGQHLFNFQSNEYFLKQNFQQETNFHNLMNPDLFSSLVYVTIYCLLVFMPLLYKLFSDFFKKFSILEYIDINPHAILVVLFASVFQIYFYDNIGTMVDMATHIIALVLFAYYLKLKESSYLLKIHYLTIVFATFISMFHYRVYGFFNMQYEIREMFVVLSSLLIFVELISKQKQISKNS